MIHQREERKTSISRIASNCRKLAGLCRIALVILVIWGLAEFVLMCYSIVVGNLDPETLPLACTVPFVFDLYLANACLLPLLLGNMLGDISETQSPFTTKNSKRLKYLAIILVIYAILEELLAFVTSNFTVDLISNSIQMGDFIRGHVPSEGTALNLFPLLMAAMFFALSYVFKYGVLLQQESDETL